MDRKKRVLLEPHSKHFEAMAAFVQESNDGELEELMDACIDASPSNCAWSIYHAAQYIKGQVQTEQNVRSRRMAQAAGGQPAAETQKAPAQPEPGGQLKI